jgi:osmoprotectant transport system substrate-binding protein
MKARRQGVLGLKDLYGITFKSFKSLDEAGPLTVAALTNGQVAAADMFSTDPAMKQFVALEDPKHMYSAQNIVPLVATKKLDDKVTAVLNAVSAALTTEDLLAMNADLSNHESFDSVATKWLTAHKLN